MAAQSAGLHQTRVFKILKKHIKQFIILDLYENVQRWKKSKNDFYLIISLISVR